MVVLTWGLGHMWDGPHRPHGKDKNDQNVILIFLLLLTDKWLNRCAAWKDFQTYSLLALHSITWQHLKRTTNVTAKVMWGFK